MANEVIDQIRETLRKRLQRESLVALKGEKGNQFLGICFEQICHQIL